MMLLELFAIVCDDSTNYDSTLGFKAVFVKKMKEKTRMKKIM